MMTDTMPISKTATLTEARARAMDGVMARWARSFLVRKDGPFYIDEPWVTLPAVQWLEELLDPQMRVFEFGSGRSTLFFARRAGQVVSAEHHAGWKNRVEDELASRGMSNVRLVLAEPDGPASLCRYRSRRRDGRGLGFERYVKSIDAEMDRSLDLVFVDGRARVACVRRALRKVAPGGWIVLDDAGRRDYEPARRLLSRFTRVDFPGVVSRMPWLSLTSAWMIAPRLL